MKKFKLTLALAGFALIACNKGDVYQYPNEDASTFQEIGSLAIGGEGAAEISAYDPTTKKLFVVTNAGSTTRIDVVSLQQPSSPEAIGYIDIAPYGGNVNSVSVSEGKLAAAVEGFQKTDPGKVLVFKTTDYALVAQVPVGALPDMITYSSDGKYILTANEGEPNDAYTVDPVGSVSIIAVRENYASTTLDFSSFANQAELLKAKGLRIFGPNASFAQDIEPEYITIDQQSKFAWVTLQENNAIAKLDIRAKKILQTIPLGFKNYSLGANAIDPSDKDNLLQLNQWPVKGMYLPDAIAFFEQGGAPYLITANEGDVREWAGFAENKRVKDLKLDPVAFPDATLKTDARLGRLNVTRTLGDIDNDGDYDELYSFGARSFSIWNASNGTLTFDSGNELERKCIESLYYDDNRSDDKGVEPEGVVLGIVGRKPVAFIGMERADAIAIYDISSPSAPRFIKLLKTGDAPEGLTFIHASESPIQKSLLVTSNEGDGTIRIYSVQ